MFIFITPDVAASSSPDADPRKKEMVMKCCLRLKVRAWGEILLGNTRWSMEHLVQSGQRMCIYSTCAGSGRRRCVRVCCVCVCVCVCVARVHRRKPDRLRPRVSPRLALRTGVVTKSGQAVLWMRLWRVTTLRRSRRARSGRRRPKILCPPNTSTAVIRGTTSATSSRRRRAHESVSWGPRWCFISWRYMFLWLEQRWPL